MKRGRRGREREGEGGREKEKGENVDRTLYLSQDAKSDKNLQSVCSLPQFQILETQVNGPTTALKIVFHEMIVSMASYTSANSPNDSYLNA